MAYNSNYQTNYGAGNAPPQPVYPPQGGNVDPPPYSAGPGTGEGWKDENNAGTETSTPTRLWVKEHRAVYFVSYGVFLVTYITLICCPKVRRSYPTNFITLGIFTLAFSYMAAMISSFYKAEAVLFAFGIAAVVCLAVTIFAMQTKFDITVCSSMLFSLLLVFLLFGFGVMIVYAVGVDNKTRWILQLVYGSLGTLIFTMFLAYDTQMLMGGRKYELSEEEYVYASLQIYLDVVYIFLLILSLFGGKD
ncbi:DgyrCDS3490 [Dimorphilus gyrociliatus]|uniref:DgyrCDS3490 n=1 Tax=Dimorphilus gyrociliatus TaxID=2664684 RepID=A0A7I8VDE1_9ANNE|nr:DgyrCDS3490 [Dimorphilus gyrociliatus]